MKLLIVDTQKLIVRENLYCFDLFVSNVKRLIRTARENQIEVIYIRHDDGLDGTLTKDAAGFEIYEEFEPCNNEKIFDKICNSPFKNTGLLEYLNSIGEKELIVAGLQTDYCIDATVKCGYEHGFRMIVPAYSNSTFDNEFMSSEESYKYYNEFMWNGRYAECISIETVICMMQKSSE